jgi:tetratricopeptide (TPR) repeat protein
LTDEARRHGAAASELEGAAQREGGLQEQVRQLTAAVEALSAERSDPDAPPGIDEALRLLKDGETAAAEAIFEEVKARRKAEGEGAFKEAAAAARHIGALAYLHDTDKALAAYREAVALDPDDPDGWNRLGSLLRRTGDLDGATEAYNRVLSLGNRTTDQGLIAVATGNLGNIYLTRGELDRAEEMYRKSLEIEEALGRKEGMANQYGNLGTVYRTRGELDRAEKMYRKSLKLHEALGRKAGMASDYGNLGILYKTRGEHDRAEEMYRKSLKIEEALGRKEGMASDYGNLGTLYKIRDELDRAEEMYEKGLELFRKIGATPQIEQTERLLAELREAE